VIDQIRSTVVVATLAATCLVSLVPQARADSAATLKALEQTPVSLLTYGLDALSAGLNGYLGRGGEPDPSAVFKSPLSGRIADMATVLYAPEDGTITLNLVKIAPLEDGQEACNQAFAAVRFFAGVDPAAGRLEPGFENSLLTSFFTASGTPVAAPANDAAALDQAFRLRYNGSANGKRFRCTAPLLSTEASFTPVP
jgi:hypothetical protein